MNLFTGANIRRLIPAGAVAAVLALSYLSPLPSFASNGGFGYNCGVKGYGYHDHGKPCPNRPKTLVGHGKQASVISATSSSTDNDSTLSATNGDTGSSGKSHGHGNDHGHGRAR